LWPSFLEDCDRKIFHLDTAERLKRAHKYVRTLVGILHADISWRLREVDRFRLKARGGKEFYDSLETKLSGWLIPNAQFTNRQTLSM
jgi:hypothetical protein